MSTRVTDPRPARSQLPPPVLIGGLVVLLIVIVRNAWVGEDAYITFRTIDNVMHGYGLRWNVDERVQTFSHPLWMFLVAAFYRFTGEPYFTSLAISIVLSMGTALLIVTRVATDPLAATLVLTTMVFSKAFVDYTTSGLENPLTNALLAAFFAVYFTARPGIGRIRALSFIAALLILNRLDAGVLILPALAAALWTDHRRRAWIAVAVGFLPLVAWEIFSVIYYGFPFPNTAYAKLATGIPGAALATQGLEYLLDSLTVDPLTLTAIAAVGAAAIAFRRRSLWVVFAGIALYLVSVVRAGGDFMSGRFLGAPLVCALVAAARLNGVLTETSMAVASLGIVLIGLAAANPTAFSGATPMSGWVEPNGIADERRYHYAWVGLLRLPPEGQWPDVPNDLAKMARANGERSIGFNNIGRFGFGAGPGVHIIDDLALSDPLLARLPAQADWRVGHFRRVVPEGYQRTLETGVNHIQDPAIAALYDDLWRVTVGPIWTRDRWAAILRLNVSGARQGSEPRKGPLPTLVAEFTVSPDPCTITGSRAAVDCVVNGERSDSIQPIVSYVWTVGGVTSGNNMRLLLPLTCANSGSTQTAIVPVTLTVKDAAGLERSATKSVAVAKRDACGF